MRVFISADIEGVAGSNFKEECRRENPEYQQFSQLMTKEVVAAAQGALEAGANEVVVKDGHGFADNIDISQMPSKVRLIRGKSGHPYNMMFGIDDSFDAAIFIGYHCGAGSPGSPLSHTSTGNTNFIKLNDFYGTEFLINSFIAEENGVPVVFLSGDGEICEKAKEINSNIKTLATKKGYGASTINLSPKETGELIKKGVKQALSGDISLSRIELPASFEETISFRDHTRAFKMKYYPNMKSIDDHTISIKSEKLIDILAANMFVL